MKSKTPFSDSLNAFYKKKAMQKASKQWAFQQDPNRVPTKPQQAPKTATPRTRTSGVVAKLHTLYTELYSTMERPELIKHCINLGYNPNTVRSQLRTWEKRNGKR